MDHVFWTFSQGEFAYRSLEPDCLEATIQKKKKNDLTIIEFTTKSVPLANGSISDSREQEQLCGGLTEMRKAERGAQGTFHESFHILRGIRKPLCTFEYFPSRMDGLINITILDEQQLEGLHVVPFLMGPQDEITCASLTVSNGEEKCIPS
ncbi:hypothetical protein MG293_002693 [Ovis ammon polii]|uniref:Uncharacterized protein n=1 Tax=Ovis ammon polii TaxID=230172 RepID=A0AAD4UF83_OVIAM|nr:hypothetical protein MG293_002693 [Ovis ammon polii]